MRIFTLATAIACGCLASLAIPAKPTPVVVTQPDGTQVTVQLRGDERHHFCLSEDGYLLVGKSDGGYYYGNVNALGVVEASDLLAREPQARTAADLAFLSKVDMPKVYDRLKGDALKAPRKQKAAANPTRLGLTPGNAYPSIGHSRGLVVLVQYKDRKFTLDDPYDYFSRMLHEEGFSDYGGTGSCRDYFIDSSNGIFKPEFDVYGPITLNYNMAYYGGNDVYGTDLHPEEMVIEACTQLDDEVDFSQYDCDGDGFIDNVYVFYAGLGEASGGGVNTVWPHSWNVTVASTKSYYFDGVRLDKYACGNEWEGNAIDGRPDGIGTFCHEFSHVMGLPDLYSTDFVTASFTPRQWSVLDYGPYNNNGRTPPLYGLFERNALGWCEPTPITGAMSATLPNLKDNVGFIIPTNNNKEFYLLENRQQEGWDTYLPGHGMLVWHIDYDANTWETNSVNNNPQHQRVDIVEADNTQDDASRAGDAFPGSTGVKSFTDSTVPSMRTWKNEPLNLPITNIREEGGMVKFEVCGGGQSVVASNHRAPTYEFLYVPGEANSWTHAKAQKLTTDDYVNYYGFANIDGPFKFTTSPDWNGVNLGAAAAAGSLTTDGGAGNLTAAKGLYWCRVNLETLTYDLTKVETIGAASEADKWASETPLKPSADMLQWTATVSLPPRTEWNMRVNGNKELTLGGKPSWITVNSSNFKTAENGIHSITLDISDQPYQLSDAFERVYLFSELAPQALPATEVGTDKFRANWTAVEGASSYTLILNKEIEAAAADDILDFTAGTTTLPAGWTSTSTLEYVTEGRYGQAPPSLRFSNNGGSITSPVYDGEIKSIQFWFVGVTAHATNRLVVTAGDAEYTYEIPNDEGKTIVIQDLPAGVRQFKIEYVVKSHYGSVAIDDIKVHWSKRQRTKVADYEVEGTSMLVTGLTPNTEHYYSVVAANAEGVKSQVSETVTVKTYDPAGIADAVAQAAVWTEGRVICADAPAEIYDVYGRRIGSAPQAVEPGVYIVAPAGAAPAKLVVR